MCATPLSTSQVTSLVSTTPVPKWLKMKQQNKSSAGKQTAKPTVQKSSGSAQQKPSEPSRNAKRARWAKKSKPVAKPSIKRGPEKEYLCECHSEPARKPKAGMKESVKDAETGKVKDKPKGLGKWRCATTGKIAKVTPRKPAPKEIVDAVRSINAASVVPIEEVPDATA